MPASDNSQERHVQHAIHPCLSKPVTSSTWVNSQWKFTPYPGHFSVEINTTIVRSRTSSRSATDARIGCPSLIFTHVFTLIPNVCMTVPGDCSGRVSAIREIGSAPCRERG